VRRADPGWPSILVTVFFTGVGLVVVWLARTWLFGALGWALIVFSLLGLALWWRFHQPGPRVSRDLELLKCEPIQRPRPFFLKEGWFSAGAPDKQAQFWWRLVIRPVRPVRGITLVCTGAVQYPQHELTVHDWREGLPPTDVFIESFSSEVRIEFRPAPFAKYHELVLILGSHAEFEVRQISAVRAT
jgi:hypothetical protein